MRQPQVTRPHFPEGYVDAPKALLAWDFVEHKLRQAKNYWLCTVRPDGRPHAVPKWAVWVDGRLYFDGSPEARHARNLAANPHVSVHLESGDEAVIVEGIGQAAPRPAPELGATLAKAYTDKYAAFGYSPQPNQWDQGGLFEITPRAVLSWTRFTDDPTKFTFE